MGGAAESLRYSLDITQQQIVVVILEDLFQPTKGAPDWQKKIYCLCLLALFDSGAT